MDGNYKHYLRPEGRGLKLHLGCGDYWFDGFINIDFHTYGGTDMKLDIREKLPFEDNTIERIEMYEVLEHFNRDEVNNLLEEFKRLLTKNGTIRLSVPDMDKLIEQYPTDKEQTILYIYGFVDHPSHKWGYTQETLKKLFEDHGFKDVVVERGFLEERPREDKLILEARYES